MRWIFDLAYVIAGLVYLPVLLYQMLRQGKNRRGWRQRFGGVPVFAAGQPRIWLHAVSLGEVNATPLLVKRLTEQLPDHEVVVSTTTDTGFARARQLYGHERVFRFPLDFSLVVSRALRRVAPTMIVLTELEVWPNLVRMARQRGIPVAVFNGRLTERSRRRFGPLRPLVRGAFRDLAWVGAQDASIARRFVELGVEPQRVSVTGSVKWDTAQVSERVEGAEELAQALGVDASRPLWVCGSTGPAEEAVVLDAYARLNGCDMQLAIVPRKPERFDEVAELIRQRGFECVRRSARVQGSGRRSATAEFRVQEERPRKGTKGTEGGDDRDSLRTQDSGLRTVVLGDTMGELRKFYSLATVVFVGRSLVPMGGSDPMEVAALGRPMIAGPHMENFAQPAEALSVAGALRRVRSAQELADDVRALCADVRAAREIGRAARQVVIQEQGATEQTVTALVRIASVPHPSR
ncbi:MAG TPA: 3-deoxy-D-manno-octulosonic acid transferase [Phycisphaerae bacterium]